MVVAPPKITFPEAWDEATKTGRWEYKEALGEGGFGVVQAALDKQNGDEKVAIKILRSTKDPYRHCLLGTKEVRQAKLFEEKVFSSTKHRLFVKYKEDHTGLAGLSDLELALFDEPDFDWENDERLKLLTVAKEPYLVMEYLQGKCVKTLLKERSLTNVQIRGLMHQAAASLWHLSTQNKIHRDFRVHNMMWDEDKLTIIDFGLVCGTNEEHAHSKNKLNRTYWKLDSYWMPPEVKISISKKATAKEIENFVPCNFLSEYPSAFDMYSFGVVSLELLLEPQYNNLMSRNQNVIEGKKIKRLRPHDAVKYLNDEKLQAVGLSKNIIMCCVSKNPAFRLTPVHLLQGFQSNFQTDKMPPPGHEKFMKKLEACCGIGRNEESLKMINELGKELIKNLKHIQEYASALVTFAEKPGVSIYRLLAVVDFCLKVGAKNKNSKMNSKIYDSVSETFLPLIKKFNDRAQTLYQEDTQDNKINRGRVQKMLKNWDNQKFFIGWRWRQAQKKDAKATGVNTASTAVPKTGTTAASGRKDGLSDDEDHPLPDEKEMAATMGAQQDESIFDFLKDSDEDDRAPSVASEDHFSQMSISEMTDPGEMANVNIWNEVTDNEDDEEVEMIEEAIDDSDDDVEFTVDDDETVVEEEVEVSSEESEKKPTKKRIADVKEEASSSSDGESSSEKKFQNKKAQMEKRRKVKEQPSDSDSDSSEKKRRQRVKKERRNSDDSPVHRPARGRARSRSRSLRVHRRLDFSEERRKNQNQKYTARQFMERGRYGGRAEPRRGDVRDRRDHRDVPPKEDRPPPTRVARAGDQYVSRTSKLLQRAAAAHQTRGNSPDQGWKKGGFAFGSRPMEPAMAPQVPAARIMPRMNMLPSVGVYTSSAYFPTFPEMTAANSFAPVMRAGMYSSTAWKK